MKIQLKKLVIACLITCITQQLSAQNTKPKRVIFLIGDGMGLTQISSAMSQYNGLNAFMRFPVIGLSKTSSARHYITDSGAGATAFSIGKKTYNGAIGVDADTVWQPTLFELAKKKKMSTGVVVTSSIAHATPASFYAHVKHRDMYDSIVTFLLNNNCDIAIGGGTEYFYNRKDTRNITAELNAKGFKVFSDSVLKEVIAEKYVYLLAKDEVIQKYKGRDNYLTRSSVQAIKNLNKNSNGYMLMVEGSQIDWGGHNNDYNYMATELWDFNETINAVLNLAERDPELLIVVTADHETGGLTLTDNKDPLSFTPTFSTTHHTGVMVPVFAFGPGSQEFAGMYENTEIFNKLVKLLNLK